MEEKKADIAVKPVPASIEGEDRFSMARLLVAFSLLIMLLNGGIMLYRALNTYDDAIEQGREDTERMRRLIADHVELTLLAADLTLRRAEERQYFNALFGGHFNEDIQNHFIQWVNETPQIAALVMTDEAGNITAIHRKHGYETWLEGKETLADQAYFTAHATEGNPDLLFISPEKGWVGDQELVLLSRRVNKINGEFGGVAIAIIDKSYFLDFFASLELEKTTQMAVLRNDGVILLNRGASDGDLKRAFQMIGPELKHQNILFDMPWQIDRTANETKVSGQDKFGFGSKNLRVISTTYMNNLQVAVAVINTGRGILKSWNDGRREDAMFLGMFGLFVMVISFFVLTMARQMHRVQKSERTAVLASQAKTDFLANMSHELRTPLNAIIGFSEMLDANYFGPLNDKQKERLNDIHACGSHLLELINDILEFSKGEAGKLELHLEQADLTKVIEESVRLFTAQAMADGVTINMHIAEGLPEMLIDERKIKQVLINLLSNAVKFTSKGGRIDVHAVQEAGKRDNDNIIVTVADTGIGMEEADIPKALSVFGQVHKNPKYGGTGLGLPLCKMLVELHGGNFTLYSSKGKGTAATFTLPVIKPETDETQA